MEIYEILQQLMIIAAAFLVGILSIPALIIVLVCRAKV